MARPSQRERTSFPSVGGSFDDPDGDGDRDSSGGGSSPADRERSSVDIPSGGGDGGDDSLGPGTDPEPRDEPTPGGFEDGSATGGGTSEGQGGGTDTDSRPSDTTRSRPSGGGSAGTPSEGPDTLIRDPQAGANAPRPDDDVLSTVPGEEALAESFADSRPGITADEVDISRTEIGGEVIARVRGERVGTAAGGGGGARSDERRRQRARERAAVAGEVFGSVGPSRTARQRETILTGADAGTLSGAAGANIGDSSRGVRPTNRRVQEATQRARVENQLESQGFDPDNFNIDTSGERATASPVAAPGDDQLRRADDLARGFDDTLDSTVASVERGVEQGIGPFGGVGNIPRIVPADDEFEPERGAIPERFEDRFGPRGGGAELAQDAGLVAADAVKGVSGAPETAVNVSEAGLFLLGGTVAGGGSEEEFDRRLERTRQSAEPIATAAANNPQRTAVALGLGTAAETALLRGVGRAGRGIDVSTPDTSGVRRAVSETRTRTPDVELVRGERPGVDVDPLLFEQAGQAARDLAPSRPSGPSVQGAVDSARVTVGVNAGRVANRAREALGEAGQSLRRGRRRAGELPADAGLSVGRARGRVGEAVENVEPPSLDVSRPDLAELRNRDARGVRERLRDLDESARFELGRRVDQARRSAPDVRGGARRLARDAGDARANLGLVAARARGELEALPDRVEGPDFDVSGVGVPSPESARSRLEDAASGVRTGARRAGQSAAIRADRLASQIAEEVGDFADDDRSGGLPGPSPERVESLTNTRVRIGPARPPRATVPDDVEDVNLGPFADDALDDVPTFSDLVEDSADAGTGRRSGEESGQIQAVRMRQNRGEADTARPAAERVDGETRGNLLPPVIPGVTERANDPVRGALNRQGAAMEPSVTPQGINDRGTSLDVGNDAGTELGSDVGDVFEFGVSVGDSNIGGTEIGPTTTPDTGTNFDNELTNPTDFNFDSPTPGRRRINPFDPDEEERRRDGFVLDGAADEDVFASGIRSPSEILEDEFSF